MGTWPSTSTYCNFYLYYISVDNVNDEKQMPFYVSYY